VTGVEAKHADAPKRRDGGTTAAQHQAEPICADPGHRASQQRRLTAAALAGEFGAEFAPHKRAEAGAKLEPREAEALGLSIKRKLLGGLLRIELVFEVFEESVPTHR